MDGMACQLGITSSPCHVMSCHMGSHHASCQCHHVMLSSLPYDIHPSMHRSNAFLKDHVDNARKRHMRHRFSLGARVMHDTAKTSFQCDLGECRMEFEPASHIHHSSSSLTILTSFHTIPSPTITVHILTSVHITCVVPHLSYHMDIQHIHSHQQRCSSFLVFVPIPLFPFHSHSHSPIQVHHILMMACFLMPVCVGCVRSLQDQRCANPSSQPSLCHCHFHKDRCIFRRCESTCMNHVIACMSWCRVRSCAVMSWTCDSTTHHASCMSFELVCVMFNGSCSNVAISFPCRPTNHRVTCDMWQGVASGEWEWEWEWDRSWMSPCTCHDGPIMSYHV